VLRLKIIKDNASESKTELLFVAIRYRTRDQRRRDLLALNKSKEL